LLLRIQRYTWWITTKRSQNCQFFFCTPGAVTPR